MAKHRSSDSRFFTHILKVLRLCGLPMLCGVVAMVLSGCQNGAYNYDATHFTTVVIDAGHGGHDSGAISHNGKVHVMEKDLALDVALRLNKKLKSAGLNTVMTRHDDTFIPLNERVAIFNSQSEAIFVAIHFNDCRKSSIHGIETYQNGRGTDGFAHRVERAVSSVPSGVNRGVMHANYRVLKYARGPSILVECGYLSNPSEAARCANPEYREKIATELADAILAQRE